MMSGFKPKFDLLVCSGVSPFLHEQIKASNTSHRQTARQEIAVKYLFDTFLIVSLFHKNPYLGLKNFLNFFARVKMEGEEPGVKESVVIWTKNN
jgi:hypothetical protein